VAELMSKSAPLLVIGSTGLLARALVGEAARQGCPLVALGRPDCDLADPASLARTIREVKPSAIVNAGAYTAVDRAESELDLAFAINRDGAAAIAREAASRNLPLVHVSTDQVFDGTGDRPWREDDPTGPLCVYGASKRAGEEAVLAAHPGALVMRVSWTFGPGGDDFVAKVLDWARRNPALRIVADQRGRPTFAPDIARACLVALDRRAQGILHVAGDQVMTRAEQARAILAAAAARGFPAVSVEPVSTASMNLPARRPLNAVLDVSRARALGITAKPFADALASRLDDLPGAGFT
jgi:dTDP-4-dehydrorhamnose reductase